MPKLVDGLYVHKETRHCYYLRKFRDTICGNLPDWVRLHENAFEVYTKLFDDFMVIEKGEWYGVGQPDFHLCEIVVKNADMKEFRLLSQKEELRARDRSCSNKNYGKLLKEEED